MKRHWIVRSFARAQLTETLRMIREDEPPKPSTRVSSLANKKSAIVAYRSTESLEYELRGDLDWIVMKALSKERNRRYDSALSLADDVYRHLNKDMVEARPPSLGYQLSRLYHRHRSLFLTLAAFFALLTVAFASVITLYLREARAVAERDVWIRNTRGPTLRRNT